MLVFLLAFLGAVIPTIVYVSIAWWFDRYEKEPWWLLAATFLWGAVPAIILAMISELALALPLAMHQSGEASPSFGLQSGEQATTVVVVTMSVIAPIAEETLKALPLLFIFLVFRHKFDGLMDGLLYGGLVGFGFAMTENFLYIFGAGASAGLTAEALVFFLRTIVFGMMHALWSSMFGIGLGIARYARSRTVAVIAPCAGLLLAMLMHGVHNFSAVSVVQGSDIALPLAVTMFASYTLGCVAWLALVFIAGRGEAAWIRAELAEEITAGLLSADQARACRRYRSRVAARWAALREHGFGHAHQLGRLYCLGAALAFKKRQLAIHPEETKNAEEIIRLREEIRQVQEALAATTPTES